MGPDRLDGWPGRNAGSSPGSGGPIPDSTSQEERWWAVLAAGIGAYGVALSVYTLLRYYDFQTLYYDFGINTYSMAQVLGGRESLPSLVLPSSPGHTGHFSPVLIFAFALYAALPIPESLLVFQSLLFAVAALPLYALAVTVLGSKEKATAVAVTYLVYPALAGSNSYDFHVEAFLPLFVFSALLALVRHQYLGFVLASILALGTHELVSFVYIWTGAVLMVYHYATRKDVLRGLVSRRYSATILALGVAVFTVADVSNRLLTPSHGSILSWFDLATGGSQDYSASVFSGVLEDLPLKVLYWVLLLAPLLLLPLRELWFLFPLAPWVGLTILSSNPAIYDIGYQYSAILIPILFFALVWALRSPRPWLHRSLQGKRMFGVLVLVVLVSASLASVLTPLRLLHSGPGGGPYPVVTSHDIATAELLGLVPLNASVLAQNELFSQVSNRRVVAITWNDSVAGPPDAIVEDHARRWFSLPVPPDSRSFASYAAQTLANHTYGIAGFSDSTFVYELGRTAPPSFADPVVSLAGRASPSNWSSLGGSVRASSAGVDLIPGAGAQALAWTRLGIPIESVLLQAELRITNETQVDARSGILLGSPFGSLVGSVDLAPATGEVHFVQYKGPSPLDSRIGTFPITGGATNLTVLLSGGSLQAFVDGRLAGAVYGLSMVSLADIGFDSFGEDLTISSFIAYQSTAIKVAAQPPIPWDGLEAMAVLLLPALVGVWFRGEILSSIRTLWRFLRTRSGGGR